MPQLERLKAATLRHDSNNVLMNQGKRFTDKKMVLYATRLLMMLNISSKYHGDTTKTFFLSVSTERPFYRLFSLKPKKHKYRVLIKYMFDEDMVVKLEEPRAILNVNKPFLCP